MARCAWPYYLSRRKRRSDVMSSMPNYSCIEAGGASSLSLMPQIEWIMARSLRRSRGSSGSLGPHVSLPWSTAERTRASYTLPCILGERCLVVRTGRSVQNFPQATQHLEAKAMSQPPPEHSISPR